MAKNIIQKITEKAEKLRELREFINQKEEEARLAVEPLKREKEAVQAELVEDMKKNGLASLKVSSGDSFLLSKKKGIEISNEVFALKWARDNNCFSVNRVVAAQRLKDVEELPAGFERVETEYISVRKAKEKGDA